MIKKKRRKERKLCICRYSSLFSLLPTLSQTGGSQRGQICANEHKPNRREGRKENKLRDQKAIERK